VYDDAEMVRRIKPDMARIAALPTFAVAITAPGSHADADVDFVSRFFAPAKGVPEDPVTGSLHCTLVPYWADRLGRKHLRARQVSARAGELECTLDDNRVELVGHAVMVLEGRLRF
jgi:predicted PhzF superfamily epimerase YddE/YHI9